MIDVLEQIEFLNSLLSDDTPTHIKESIEKRIGGGGSFVRPHSPNFPISINILVGIYRSLASLVQLPLMKLDTYQFERHTVT